tara:strand:- start:6 stop:179 length:174 start_codon:yes stop_codon:yes gene_type:complete
MTKAQKSMFKSLKKESHRVGFIQMLTAQQERLGKYSHWDLAYRKKLAKRKIAAEKLL